MAASMTYSSLLEDLQRYAERSDSAFVDQLPRIVMLAENRIAAEVRGLGLMRSVTGDLIGGQSYLDKPARWRETVSFQIGTGLGGNNRVILLERPVEYCRNYWPNATKTGVPRYYADWTYDQWLLVPTPSSSFPYEVIYHERPQPLDDTHQTNWTTVNAPQLLLYACLLELQSFLKNFGDIPAVQAQYDRALKQFEFEQKRRLMDRSHSVVNNA